MKDVYLKEIDGGFLVLVDKHGEIIGSQKQVNIFQSVNELTEVTVTFLLSRPVQMDKDK